MTNNKNSESFNYKIGAVSRMTGIAPDTLRIWERRYDVVTPERTPAGGRLYSQEQISRLSLIKNLVDAGDSISSVAALSLKDLQNRLSSNRQANAPIVARISGRPCRLVIFGESLKLNMSDAEEQMDGLEVLGSFADIASFETKIESLEPDVLLVEVPTLHEDSAHRVIEWLQRSGALHVILVYRFGNTESFRRLPKSKCSILRAPVDAYTIQRHCQSLLETISIIEDRDSEALSFIGEMAAPRKYDDETLARIATQSEVIKCECPRHLSELITSLAAFERYSTECESLSPEDAALHAYLNVAASQARVMIEDALSRVIDTENIEI